MDPPFEPHLRSPLFLDLYFFFYVGLLGLWASSGPQTLAVIRSKREVNHPSSDCSRKILRKEINYRRCPRRHRRTNPCRRHARRLPLPRSHQRLPICHRLRTLSCRRCRSHHTYHRRLLILPPPRHPTVAPPSHCCAVIHPSPSRCPLTRPHGTHLRALAIPCPTPSRPHGTHLHALEASVCATPPLVVTAPCPRSCPRLASGRARACPRLRLHLVLAALTPSLGHSRSLHEAMARPASGRSWPRPRLNWAQAAPIPGQARACSRPRLRQHPA